MAADLGEVPAAGLVGRVAVAGEDGVEDALTGAEVVVQGRDVALAGRLGDLPDGDLPEPTPREQPLRLPEEAGLGGRAVAGHGVWWLRGGCYAPSGLRADSGMTVGHFTPSGSG